MAGAPGLWADAALPLLAVALALAIDWRWGEPRAWHPVVGMGRYLGLAGRWLMRRADAGAADTPAGRWTLFTAGAGAWCLGAAGVGAVAALLQWGTLQMPLWAAVALLGLALKPLLAWRMLHDEVAAVEAALAVSLDAGRARLARLVSRDVAQLTEAEVRESAIETLAENLNDSVVAPLFWFLLLGLPGAAIYRFANTADAMWGYRGQWEWAGKWAARADDLLSWVPARITAALLLGARPALWARLPTEARRTPSPNGGWPMGAMALRLGVRLSKPGVYQLNAGGRSPGAADIGQALKFGKKSALAIVLLGLTAIYLIAFILRP